jgi:hypothetical protein
MMIGVASGFGQPTFDIAVGLDQFAAVLRQAGIVALVENRAAVYFHRPADPTPR